MQTIAASHVVVRASAPAAQQRGRAAVSMSACSLSVRRAACFGSAQTVSSVAYAAQRPAARASTVQVSAMARFTPERTYIMIKPDGVQRGLVGEIISRFENKGFVLRGLKQFNCPKELAEEHYKDLSAKPFFKDLVAYIISGPVICMVRRTSRLSLNLLNLLSAFDALGPFRQVWEGVGAVKAARKLIGATNPTEAEAGTIRGDLAVEVGRNVVHGSDSVENGEREIALWFKGDKLCEWTPANEAWVREL